MRARHHLRPNQQDNFELETSDSALEFWNKIKSYLVLAGVALPAIGLVVGAIVIMNIMLVAVAERTREIGIRKSLGARRRDIMSQFLVESATLSTVGAALGVATGLRVREAHRRRDAAARRGRAVVGRSSASASAPASASSPACIRRAARRGSIRSPRCGQE